MHGQIVQQFRVRRILADGPEILGALDQSGAEQFLPVAVHDHAAGEGILFGGQPLREAQAVLGRVFGQRVQRREDGGLDRVAGAVVRAADEDMRDRHRARFFLHDESNGAAIADGFLFALELRFLDECSDVRMPRAVGVEEFVGLLGAAILGRFGESLFHLRKDGELMHFAGRQFAVVDAHVLNQRSGGHDRLRRHRSRAARTR